jgi:plastocyanin
VRAAARPAALALLTLLGTGACTGSRADVSVAMTGERRFEPTTVAVPVGGTVTWENTGVTAHTVTAIGEDRTTPTGAFDSGAVVGTGTFSHTFDEAGAFTYTCTIHGGEMVGLVEVGS